MFERIRHMLIKEFIQVFRDPRMRMVVFVVPVFQLLVFGYAASTDVRNAATAVLDQDHSVTSRDLVARFLASGYFRAVAWVDTEADARDLVDRGRAQVVLHLRHGFENDLRAGRTAPLQVIVDGTDSNTAGIILGYSAKIVNRFVEDALRSRNARLRGAVPLPGQVRLETRTWFNENLESRNFYVPGVMAMLIMIMTLLLTSMAVVREREVGTMEQIMVTPMSPGEFILGKTVPFALVGFVDAVLVTAVAVFWFGVPIRGSLALLFVGTALYLMNTLGIGLLISTLSQTQQQAMMTTFFFAFPAMLLSGFIFPIANMPRVIQWFTYANPLRYFLVVVRGIFLKAVGLDILWPQLLALGVLGTLALCLATRRFHKTLA